MVAKTDYKALLAQSEAREAEVRSLFKKYDLDGSGTYKSTHGAWLLLRWRARLLTRTACAVSLAVAWQVPSRTMSSWRCWTTWACWRCGRSAGVPRKGDAEKGAAPATRDAGIRRRPGTASGLFGLSAIEKDPHRCVVNSSASVRSSLWCHAGRQALVNRFGLSCVCSSGQHILGLEFGLQA